MSDALTPTGTVGFDFGLHVDVPAAQLRDEAHLRAEADNLAETVFKMLRQQVCALLGHVPDEPYERAGLGTRCEWCGADLAVQEGGNDGSS